MNATFDEISDTIEKQLKLDGPTVGKLDTRAAESFKNTQTQKSNVPQPLKIVNDEKENIIVI